MSWEAVSWASKQVAGSPANKCLLILLANCHGPEGIFPFQDYLADLCEMNVRTIQRRLADLENRDLIRREARKNKRGWRTSDRYELVGFDVNEFHGAGRKLGTEKTTTETQPDKVSPRDDPNPTNRAKSNTTPVSGQDYNKPVNLTKSPLTPLAGGDSDALLAEFAECWDAYPQKVKRTAALQAYKVKRGTVSADTLLTKIREYAAVPRGKSFYHRSLARWLDEDGHLDEYPDQAAPPLPPTTPSRPIPVNAPVARGLGGMFIDGWQRVYSKLIEDAEPEQRDLIAGLMLTIATGKTVTLTAPTVEWAEDIAAQFGPLIADRWADEGFDVQIRGRMPGG